MKIRGSAKRRLRCMARVMEKLSGLLAADMASSAQQVHGTLRFCGVQLPKVSREVPSLGPRAETAALAPFQWHRARYSSQSEPLHPVFGRWEPW